MNEKSFQLTLTGAMQIKDVQTEFAARFPYLKIEFFTKSQKPGEATHRRLMKDPQTSLRQLRAFRAGTVTIDGTMSVTELEKALRNTCGLNVQVFRKSGKTWLETSVTDEWTLSRQNLQGETL